MSCANHRLRWQRLPCHGDQPGGRVGETLTAVDAANGGGGVVALYGGMRDGASDGSGPEYFSDLYVFDPVQRAWAKVPASPPAAEPVHSEHEAPVAAAPAPPDPTATAAVAPPPRAFHTCVARGGRLIIYGGCSANDRHGDVVEVDPVTGAHHTLPPATAYAPPPRYCHSAAIYGDAMYIFGGKHGVRDSDERLADLHRFDFATQTWARIEPCGSIPPPLSAHSAVVCGKRMFVVGGRESGRSACSGLYEFDFETRHWRRGDGPETTSLERARHSAVLHNGAIVVFGGWNGKRRLDDLCVVPLDGSRAAASAAGADEGDSSGSPRRPLSPTSSSPVAAPGRRDCHAAVMWRNTMIVFAGRCSVRTHDDVLSVQLGPPSLVDRCRDWLLRHRVPIPEDLLPTPLADRVRAWRDLHTP